MSSIIEAAARAAKAGITGVVDPVPTEGQQNNRGGDMIRNMATGGLALGAGTGAVVALLNYLKSLKEEAAVEDESRLNDDTLYIPAISKAAADEGVNRWIAPGLALTSGILSAGGAYALTQSIYNYLQKKRRQRMLDEAQGEALLASDEEIAKAASDSAKMGFYDLVTAFPVAIPLLAALASGGVAYTALNKTFPTVRSPKSKYPRRIRQVSSTGQVDEVPEEVEEQLKSAADYAAEADLEDAALEFLLLTVDQMSQHKSASFSVTSDILNRTAKEGLSGVVRLQKTAGLSALVEGTKGASDIPASLEDKVLAAAALCKSARLRPVVSALAAAEFQELAPDLYDTVVSYGEEHLDKMAGVAPLFHMTYFRPLLLKSAATGNPLLEELAQLMAPQETDVSALTSDVHGSGTDDAEGEDVEHSTAPDDVVDLLIGQDHQESPILSPQLDEDEEETVNATDVPGTGE